MRYMLWYMYVCVHAYVCVCACVGMRVFSMLASMLSPIGCSFLVLDISKCLMKWLIGQQAT